MLKINRISVYSLLIEQLCGVKLFHAALRQGHVDCLCFPLFTPSIRRWVLSAYIKALKHINRAMRVLLNIVSMET